jgi:hypothetical protein
MTAWKKKLGAGLAALALVVGALPGTVGLASAYEDPKGGQHLERPPRHWLTVTLISIVVLVGGFFVLKGGNDRPASP